MKNRRVALFLIILILTIGFSSCSYVDFENRLKNKIIAPDETKFNAEIKPSADAELIPMGREIIINDGVSVTSYTVTGVNVYDSYTAAGVKSEQLAVDNAQEKSSVPFVTVDLSVCIKKSTVKTEYYNIAVLHLLGSEIFAEPWKTHLPEMSYFSLSQSGGSDYFHYNLAEGETMNCRVGWILDDVNWSEDSLILHVGADINADNYVSLKKE